METSTSTSSLTLATAPAPEAPKAARRLIMFADGTSRDGFTMATNRDTNVWRMYRVIQNAPTQEGDMEQVLIWCPGVGMSEGEKSLESLLGSNLRRNVRWAFDKLRKEYQPGDEIILCGFSRGAWIMRAVAAIVGDIGLPRLPEHQIDAVFDEYAAHPVWDKHASLSSNSNKPSGPSDKAKQARKMAEWCREEDPHRVEIKALVLFDTVGAIGGPWSHSHLSQSRFLGFPVEVIGSHVENTFHAVAADDRRKLFWPTRAELSDDAKEAGRVLKQCWFGGWHADVGGGWDATENSAITLTWMIANLQQCTTLRICRASLEAIPGGYTDPVKKGLTFEGSKKIPRSTSPIQLVAAPLQSTANPKHEWGTYPSWPEFLPRMFNYMPWLRAMRPPMSEGDSVHPSALTEGRKVERDEFLPKLNETLTKFPVWELLPLERELMSLWPTK